MSATLRSRFRAWRVRSALLVEFAPDEVFASNLMVLGWWHRARLRAMYGVHL